MQSITGDLARVRFLKNRREHVSLDPHLSTIVFLSQPLVSRLPRAGNRWGQASAT